MIALQTVQRTAVPLSNTLDLQQQLNCTFPDSERKSRRRPSPGLAARLKALGFGQDLSKSISHSPLIERGVGRIPEERITHLDHTHLANSSQTPIIQRGRAWSGASGFLTPQITGGSYSDSSSIPRTLEGIIRRTSSATSLGSAAMNTYADLTEMDTQKYRLPEHTNGNGTKAMSETKQAHIERDIPPDDDIPPPPISKEAPPGETTFSDYSGDPESYFNPLNLKRTGSIYTLSRASFANQLAQLTSLQLPDAKLLYTKVSSIPTSIAASRALMGAAEQIRSWISKASEVVSGLDGDDDVEWAAAGGREGLAEVDSAISRFTQLINVYVSAIENLQNRDDITTVSTDELMKVVGQMETIMAEWDKMKVMLRAVKNSVEIAMEWEELWNTVLGDIGNEMDILARLVFEMEEKRHKSLMTESSGDNMDINELETIVEETPPAKTRLQATNRFSAVHSFPLSPNSPSTMAPDDSSLLALFARMQPLRASLDFLPMRLATFHARAEHMFPTACDELEGRRDGLENSWKKLEKDAESLRHELGEDRWVLVFRGAGRQAQKMYESVNRSVIKLSEAIDAGGPMDNSASMSKKIESYEAKKVHYGPAIERVLSIIEKGVKDRLTVNGEILRLHSEMQKKWQNLKEQMSNVDAHLDEVQAEKKGQHLRDSISSMLSYDRSTIGSNYDTPGSSPASSIVADQSTPVRTGKLGSAGKIGISQLGARRNSSMPPGSQLTRRSVASRVSSVMAPASRASETPSPAGRQGSATPTGNRTLKPSLTHQADGRPRWNASVIVSTRDGMTGHTFKPLGLTTPSPNARNTGPPLTYSNRSASQIPLRSPLSRGNTASPLPESTPTRKSNSRAGFRDRISSPGPYSQEVLAMTTPARPRNLATKLSMSALGDAQRRSSMQPLMGSQSTTSVPTVKTTRPASSLATNRRTSLLPVPRGRQSSGVMGRESPVALVAAARTMGDSSQTSSETKSKAQKPWRG